ncbi:MAG: cytidine deaminase [Clostridia bacterium]|nr:cytidine deaminase [Clostridia bacterium]
MDKTTEKRLLDAAIEAMHRAYAPYSHFHVGAALLDADGRIWQGCNIENASYPATICAERSAISAAVSAGVRKFSAIAIVGGPNGEIGDICTPCGICRQVLCEFCPPDFPVYLGHSQGHTVLALRELLPYAFSLLETEVTS